MSVHFVSELPDAQRGGPRPSKRKGLHDGLADALRARPGVWAVWPNAFSTLRQPHSLVTSIRRGLLASFPAGEFEAAARNGVVYVRFVGGAA